MALKLKFLFISLVIFISFKSLANKSFNSDEVKELLPIMTEQCFVKHNEADPEGRFRDKDLYVYCECIMKTILNTDDAKEIFYEIDKGNISLEVYKDLVNESAKNCINKTPKEI